MVQATAYRHILVSLFLVFLYRTAALAVETSPFSPQGQEPSQDAFFNYSLRPGESLSDVARIFRVPVDELSQLNRVTDYARLQVGQTLRIPNVFVRQIADLRAERERLLEAEQRARHERDESQRTLTALTQDQQRLEGERAALSARLAATTRWKQGALLMMGVLAVMLCWNLSQRTHLTTARKEATLLANANEALTAAKEKYRQAAAHLELRYQKLYRAGETLPPKVIQEGVVLLERAFNEGSIRLEQLLATMQQERQAVQAALQTRDRHSLGQWVRGVFVRHRLKYREA